MMEEENSDFENTTSEESDENLEEENSDSENTTSKESDENLEEENSETYKGKSTNLNSKVLLIVSIGLLSIASLGIYFFLVGESNSSINNQSTQDVTPETTMVTIPAIQEALDLGDKIGCDTTHFDNDYGRLPCGDKETYLEKIRLYETQRSTTRLYSVIFVFLLIVIILIFYLQKQSQQYKSIQLNGEEFLMPKEWVAVINKLVQSNQQNEEVLKRLYFTNEELPQNFSNLQNTFLELQKKLNTQDLEIERLRKGYDNHITKKIITGFIKVFNYVEELKSQSLDEDSLINISLLLQDALEDCNVYQFTPPLGSDFREAEGLDSHPEIVETDKQNLNYKIAEVKKPGFKITYQDETEILQPASVTVYKFKEIPESDLKEED